MGITVGESTGKPEAHADTKAERMDQDEAPSLPFFARSWRLARSFTGGVSNIAGMVWRSDRDFERALDNLSK